MKSSLVVGSLLVLLVSFGFSAGLIDISYSGITISQSGSYIVVADLTTGQDLNCITIATSNVTIDLNGHTLYGAGTTTGSSGCGVYAISGCNNITVKNGTVRDFRDSGVYLAGSNHQVTQIRAYGNRSYGIVVFYGSLVKDDIASRNVDDGISAGYGCSVTSNIASDNSDDGIYAGYGCTVTGNSACDNIGFGLNVSSGCTVIGNTAYGNDSSGIRVIDGCIVMNNGSRGNSYAGIQATGTANSISQNLCTSNTAYGLLSAGGNYFEQNKLRDNDTDESFPGSTEGTGELANVIIP